MNKFTAQQIINAFKSKGYDLKESPYQMNIFGIRNSN
jgi:hypothetical protein